MASVLKGELCISKRSLDPAHLPDPTVLIPLGIRYLLASIWTHGQSFPLQSEWYKPWPTSRSPRRALHLQLIQADWVPEWPTVVTGKPWDMLKDRIPPSMDSAISNYVSHSRVCKPELIIQCMTMGSIHSLNRNWVTLSTSVEAYDFDDVKSQWTAFF